MPRHDTRHEGARAPPPGHRGGRLAPPCTGALARSSALRCSPLCPPSRPCPPPHTTPQGKLWTARARTEGQFEATLEEALRRRDELCFIEVARTRRRWRAGAAAAAVLTPVPAPRPAPRPASSPHLGPAPQVIIHRDDCSRELLEWGTRVAAANSRPPNPQ
jgi:hypothetical protein